MCRMTNFEIDSILKSCVICDRCSVNGDITGNSVVCRIIVNCSSHLGMMECLFYCARWPDGRKPSTPGQSGALESETISLNNKRLL